MKLPILLKALRQEEYPAFEKFLRSPFFKASDLQLKFFRYLRKRHSSLDLTNGELEEACRHFFGKKDFTESKMYNLVSGLGKHIVCFLSTIQFMESADEESLRLQESYVKALGKRHAGSFFRTEANRVIETIEKITVKSEEDYLLLHQLHEEVYFNPDTPKYKEAPVNLLGAMDNLDWYYRIAKLRYLLEMKLRERILGASSDQATREASWAVVAPPEVLEQHPLTAIYYRLWSMYVSGFTVQDFKALTARFADSYTVLQPDDQRFIVAQLINCGIFLNVLEGNGQQEMLTLYKMAIDTGILPDNDRITYISFLNIVTLAALCKDFEWADDFIVKYSGNIEVFKRKPSVDFSKAILSYERGDLDGAYKHLEAEIFSVPSFDITARGLLLKILFDRYILHNMNREILLDFMEAYERFMLTKQLSEKKLHAQLNYIRFTKKLANVKFRMVQVPEAKKEKLRAELADLKPVVSRKWLERKIEAL